MLRLITTGIVVQRKEHGLKQILYLSYKFQNDPSWLSALVLEGSLSSPGNRGIIIVCQIKLGSQGDLRSYMG